MVVSSLTGGLRRVNPSVDLDEKTLIEIAQITGGRYFRAKDTSALQEIYRLLDDIEPVPEPEAGFRPVQAFFFWPLGLSLLIAIFLALMNLLKNGGLSRIREVIK